MKDGWFPPAPAQVMNEKITAHIWEDAYSADRGTRFELHDGRDARVTPMHLWK